MTRGHDGEGALYTRISGELKRRPFPSDQEQRHMPRLQGLNHDRTD